MAEPGPDFWKQRFLQTLTHMARVSAVGSETPLCCMCLQRSDATACFLCRLPICESCRGIDAALYVCDLCRFRPLVTAESETDTEEEDTYTDADTETETGEEDGDSYSEYEEEEVDDGDFGSDVY